MGNDEFLEYSKEQCSDEGYVNKLQNSSYHFIDKNYTYDIYIPESCTSGNAEI